MDHTNDNYENDAAFLLAQAREILGSEKKELQEKEEEKVMICIMSGTISNIKNTFKTIKDLMGT